MLSQEYKLATTGLRPWEILLPSPLPSNLVPITERLRNCCYIRLQSVGIFPDVSEWLGPLLIICLAEDEVSSSHMNNLYAALKSTWHQAG